MALAGQVNRTEYLPLWAAVIASAVVFGLGHAYQGPAGVAKVFVVGLVFAAFYLATGAVFFPILVHVLADALQLAAARDLLDEEEAIESVPGTPA